MTKCCLCQSEKGEAEFPKYELFRPICKTCRRRFYNRHYFDVKLSPMGAHLAYWFFIAVMSAILYCFWQMLPERTWPKVLGTIPVVWVAAEYVYHCFIKKDYVFPSQTIV